MNAPEVITRRLKPFTYFAPATMEETFSILRDHDGKAVLFAGGTDLVSMMKLRKTTPEALVSLKGIPGLDTIRKDGACLRIGPLTTIASIRASDLIRKEFPALHETTKGFATPQIRNMATIGGNICRSSPCANTPPPLMTLGAEVRLVGHKGERFVKLEDFFTGAGENVLDREVLAEIVVPLPKNSCGTAFMELTRNSSDVSKVTCAVSISIRDGKCQEAKIVLGSVADRIVRAKKAEEVLIDVEINDQLIEEASENTVSDIAPITDARSEAEYRKEVSKVLVKRTIRLAAERATKAGM